MKSILSKISTISLLLTLSACCCTPPPVGGPCEYEMIKGTAEITDLKPVQDASCKNQATAVYFRFIPDAPVADQTTLYLKKALRLEANGKDVFALSWLTQKGFVTGSKHPVIFSSIQKGSCTPFSFYFREIGQQDYQAMRQACQGAR